jgi:hypothetical protein
VNYHPEMIRLPAVLAGVVALGMAGPTPVVFAEPSPPPCNYTLSPPHVVELSGTSVVTATVTPAACDQSVTFQMVACVQLQGSSDAEQCAVGQGILPAQVFYQPYRSGATYIATGRGCASTGNPPQPFCQPRGPLVATL